MGNEGKKFSSELSVNINVELKFVVFGNIYEPKE